jgi:hypothetical protein
MALKSNVKITGFPKSLVSDVLEIEGTRYFRDGDGVWRFAENGIKVPGARDLTLTERFKPKVVMAGGKVERVVLAGRDIREHPDLLSWALDAGQCMRGPDGEIDEVFIPHKIWEKHDQITHAMVAPEHSFSPSERELALAERQFREAEQRLEVAAAKRAEVLRESAHSLTRQEARAITGLSVGRIQQLVSGSSEDFDQLDHWILDTAGSGRNGVLEKNFLNRLYEQTGIFHPTELVRMRLNSLVDRGQLRRVDGRIRLTQDGRKVLARTRVPSSATGM